MDKLLEEWVKFLIILDISSCRVWMVENLKILYRQDVLNAVKQCFLLFKIYFLY
jgi:hypothetical protein